MQSQQVHFVEPHLIHFVEMKCGDGRHTTLQVKQVERRDIECVDYTYERLLGFRFFDVTAVKFEGEILRGKPKNISGWYYKGKKMNREQLKEVQTEEAASTLYAMETYMKDECVDTGKGIYFILEKDDVVLEG